MRTIESEFPNYDNVHLDIPPFVGEPWRDDVCPRYVWRGKTDNLAGCELTLWVDYLDPAKRENEGSTMYFFWVGIEDDGRPLAEFWGESQDELRGMLNDWYEKHIGYRPDAGAPLPLGELLHRVGVAAFLRVRPHD